jgi:hypothetical protein
MLGAVVALGVLAYPFLFGLSVAWAAWPLRSSDPGQRVSMRGLSVPGLLDPIPCTKSDLGSASVDVTTAGLELGDCLLPKTWVRVGLLMSALIGVLVVGIVTLPPRRQGQARRSQRGRPSH